ncbi:MAG: hypothetical protein ACK4N5_04945, partial [Myxococcales bacterium]
TPCELGHCIDGVCVLKPAAPPDAGLPDDGGTPGEAPGAGAPQSCGCGASPSLPFAPLALLPLLRRRWSR